jgi:hypothetical protein
MKGKIGGLLVTALIVMVIVAISWRVAFLKKLVYGA